MQITCMQDGGGSTGARLGLATVLAAGLVSLAWAEETADTRAAADRRISEDGIYEDVVYEDGVIVSGAPPMGTLGNGLTRRGKQAACISCHQRSGFGRGRAAT